MIKNLAAKGKHAGEISREVGVAENTARKYMTQPAKPHGLKGRTKLSRRRNFRRMVNRRYDPRRQAFQHT